MEEFSELLKVMEVLRGDKGCPWDKKQTLKAFKTFLLEEVYELIEAIGNNDSESIKEELGDILFHIVFMSQICKEERRFEIKDVINCAREKMIRRHPHVFGNEQPPVSVPQRWEEIKRNEKNNYSLLSNIPKTLPALLKAYVVTKRVSRVGFDWKNINDVYRKLDEEINELKEAQKSGNIEKVKEEIGDILFTIVNLSRLQGIDPEDALRGTIEKFVNRFEYIQNRTDIGTTNLDEMDRLWEEIKSIEKKGV
ncbi:MAG: nucleoside triphosphate pyrophosphohydrolase [Deltaproteobacteria bacterium]|nr:nucleoside triphosphate pyrophosphohydrolase [Deltaproteobacteria bacterium]